jgi:hypothetical protein
MGDAVFTAWSIPRRPQCLQAGKKANKMPRDRRNLA